MWTDYERVNIETKRRIGMNKIKNLLRKIIFFKKRKWLLQLIKDGIELSYFPEGAILSDDMESILFNNGTCFQDTECWDMYYDSGDSPRDAILKVLSYTD